MSALDPSYLRSIRDGILNGNIEANNNEALPDGLVGLYDKELFPPTIKWKDRSELLHFFLVFALAQKEISAEFAAEILGDEWYNQGNEQTSKEEKRLQRVNELIQLYSKRFSSAGGGKYRLYHERFRMYVLQKVSEEDIVQFNAKFIALCEKALEVPEKDIPEKESYALEYITTHFYISAMQGEKEGLNKEHATALKKYAYDQQFWERQIKASKGFEWSKKMLNQMMNWAAKFNDDEEVIECALNKVDLYNQEQNDAPRIVQLVADGDIETALERIKKFGGKDKEGLRRKFILYMLCLMELTLLDSKDKNHAKASIEKILKHLDEQLPIDHSVLNWNDFFPSYSMFQMASVWRNLNLDIKVITNRTNRFDYDWIASNGSYDRSQVELLLDLSGENDFVIEAIADAGISHNNFDTALELIEKIRNPIFKYHLLARLSTAVKDNQNKKWNPNNFMSRSTDLVSEIEYQTEKSIAYVNLATECYKQLEYDKMGQFIDQSLSIARSIDRIEHKCQTLSLISLELVKQNNYSKANEILEEGLTLSSGNSEWSKKIKEIFSNFVQVELKINRTFSSTLNAIRKIPNIPSKAQGLAAISTQLFLMNFISDTELILEEAIFIAEQIENDFTRDSSFKSIAIELCIQDKLHLTLDIRNKLSHWVVEKMFFREIIEKLIELNSINEAKLILNDYAVKLDDITSITKRICAKQIESKNTEDAFNLLLESIKKLPILLLKREEDRFFSPEHSKSRFLVTISSDLAKIGKFGDAKIMIDAVDNKLEKVRVIQAVSIHLTRSGFLEEAVQLLEKFTIEDKKKKIVSATFEIFKVLYRQVDLKVLLERLLGVLDLKQKSDFLNRIVSEMRANGLTEDFEVVKNFLSKEEKEVFHLKTIEMQLLECLEEGNYNEALKRIESIEDSSEKISLSLALALKCIALDKVDFAYELGVNALQKESTEAKHLYTATELSVKFEEVSTELSYQILFLVKKNINQIDSSSDKEALIRAFCSQLINLNRAEEALEALNKVKNLRIIIEIAFQLLNKNEKQKTQLLVEKIIDLLNEEKMDSNNEFSGESENQNLINCQIDLFELTTKLNMTELSEKLFTQILHLLKNNGNQWLYLPHFDPERIVGHLAITILNTGHLAKLFQLIKELDIFNSPKIIQACARSGDFKLAEQISLKLKISQHALKSCWEEIGEIAFKNMGFENTYKISEQIESDEIKKSFKLGILYHLYGNQKNEYLSSKERTYIKKETMSLIVKDKMMGPKEYNYVLQIYAINQLFFSNLPQEKLNRYNRTLNLQWAIDIKNQLPN